MYMLNFVFAAQTSRDLILVVNWVVVVKSTLEEGETVARTSEHGAC